jgi:hypothetical protein
MGELPEKDLMDNYVTFVAGIFRSVKVWCCIFAW